MIREKNAQLTEVQFHIKHGIAVLLSARIKWLQLNTIIKCSTFLQVDCIQINQQASVIKSTLQSQTNMYFSLCLTPQTHVPALPPPMEPQQLLLILRPHFM